jgi:multimeric flavodoxin WrbA
MKVVAFNGSARKNGNTAILIRKVFEELEKAGIQTELVELSEKKIAGCIACRNCFKNKDFRCAQAKDGANECIAKMREADGIILGSPVYFADVTASIKGLMERAGFVNNANDGFLRRKAGAAVVAVRRGGAIHAFDTLNHFFGITQMITVGSSYWNLGLGREAGEVEGDEEGMRTMRVLGENLAWVMGKLSK